MSILTTDRLHLDRLTTADASFIFELVNEPAWIRNIGDRGVRDLAAAEQYLVNGPIASYAQHGFGLYRVGLRGSDVPIGICGLLKRETLDDVDIGFAFLQRYWGNGYAAEAARAVLDYGHNALGIDRIIAITAAHNDASMRVLEKIGLRFQGMIMQPGYSEPGKLFGPEV